MCKARGKSSCKSASALILALFSAVCLAGIFPACKNEDNDSPKEEKKCTVTFLSGDGYWKTDFALEIEKKVSVTYGSLITSEKKPEAPQRQYCAFTGWYERIGDTVSGIHYGFDTPITKDTTLVAGWKVEASYHTIRYEVNGGSVVVSETVVPGEAPKKPADPTKNGKHFAGWYTDKDCTDAFNFNKPLGYDVTVYAKWADYYGTLADFSNFIIQNKASFAAQDASYTFYFTDGGSSSEFGPEVREVLCRHNSYYIDLSELNREYFDSTIFCGDSSDNGIVSFIYPAGVKKISARSFKNYKNLRYVKFPSALTDIGDEAFFGCGLTHLDFPSTLKTIGIAAFQDNDGLTKVVFPEGLQVICEYAFAGIDAFNTELPASLKTLDPFAFVESIFGDCKIRFCGTMAQFKGITIPPPYDNGKDPFTIVCSDGEITDSHVYLRTVN